MHLIVVPQRLRRLGLAHDAAPPRGDVRALGLWRSPPNIHEYLAYGQFVTSADSWTVIYSGVLTGQRSVRKGLLVVGTYIGCHYKVDRYHRHRIRTSSVIGAPERGRSNLRTVARKVPLDFNLHGVP